MSLMDRLLQDHVKVEGPLETECWLWTGATTGANYGSVWWEGKYISVHRAAFECSNGPIPKGIWVLHKCDNPCCFNPDHLFSGTGQDNAIDMHTKGCGFIPQGERQGQSKLKEAEVLEIRRLLNEGHTQRSLGETYGVSHSIIGRIGKRQAWGWLQ